MQIIFKAVSHVRLWDLNDLKLKYSYYLHVSARWKSSRLPVFLATSPTLCSVSTCSGGRRSPCSPPQRWLHPAPHLLPETPSALWSLTIPRWRPTAVHTDETDRWGFGLNCLSWFSVLRSCPFRYQRTCWSFWPTPQWLLKFMATSRKTIAGTWHYGTWGWFKPRPDPSERGPLTNTPNKHWLKAEIRQDAREIFIYLQISEDGLAKSFSTFSRRWRNDVIKNRVSLMMFVLILIMN